MSESPKKKGCIVTTTINPATEAIRLYDQFEDWDLIVVGDANGPKNAEQYGAIRGFFMPWDLQIEKYPSLCRIIGPASVQRGRMIAFIEAYVRGYQIIASIDDDVTPYKFWGRNVHVGRPTVVNCFEAPGLVFDPYSVCEVYHIPHARGFPVDCLDLRRAAFKRKAEVIPLIQVDLCDGQADFDAMTRLSSVNHSDYVFPSISPFMGLNEFSPINTQNTFFHRSALPHFWANIPFIGRADDIWAGYIFQSIFPGKTIYCESSGRHDQSRTFRGLMNDLMDELEMYRRTSAFLNALKMAPSGAPRIYLKEASQEAVNAYLTYLKRSDPGKGVS